MSAFAVRLPLPRHAAPSLNTELEKPPKEVLRRRRPCIALATPRQVQPLSEVLRSAVVSGATAKVPSLVQNCLEHPPLDLSLWHSAFSVCIAKHDYDAAVHVLRLGVQSYPAGALPRRTLVRPLLTLARLARWRALFSLLDTLRSRGSESAPDERLLVSIANAAVDRRNFRVALSFLALVERYGLQLSPVGYSVLLKTHGRSRNTLEVRRIVDELCSGRVSMDSVLLNSAVDALVRCDELRTAYKLVKEVKYDALIDAASYNTIIKGFAQRELVEEAFEAARRMSNAGLEQTDVTRNTLLSACVRAGDFDRAWKLADSVATTDAQLSRARKDGDLNGTSLDNSAFTTASSPGTAKQLTIALTALVAGLAEKGHVSDALALLNDMSRRNAPPSDITYAAFISACFRRGAVDDAIKVFKSIPRPRSGTDDKDVKTLHVCNSLICGLCHVGDEYHVNLAAAFLNDMNVKANNPRNNSEDNFLRPSVESYNALLDGFVRCGCLDRAEHFLSVMEQNSCRPNITSFSIMMKGYGDARNYTMAKKGFREISRRGLRPDRIALNTFLSICARSRDLSAASHVLGYMERNGGAISPGVYSYTPLILAHLRASDFHAAWSLYHHMRGRQVKVNAYLVELLTSHTIQLAVDMKRGGKHGLAIDEVAIAGANLLSEGHKDGVEARVLRKCRRKMLGVFLKTRAERHFRGLDSPDMRSASEDIFEKHGWNEIDSGWRVL